MTISFVLPSHVRLRPVSANTTYGWLALLTHPWATLRCWAARAHQRRQLLGLSPEGLDDIGVTREMAAREAAKPAWQA